MLFDKINKDVIGATLVHWAPRIRNILFLMVLVLSLLAPEVAFAEGVEGGMGGG